MPARSDSLLALSPLLMFAGANSSKEQGDAYTGSLGLPVTMQS